MDFSTVNFEKLEKTRKISRFGMFVVPIGFIIAPIGIFLMESIPIGLFGFLLIVAGMIVHAIYSREYLDEFSYTFIKGAFEEVFPGCTYSRKGFDSEIIRNSYLIPMGNEYSSDDYVNAEYKGCHIERADIHTVEVTNTGKTTTRTTMFEGTYLILSFPKKISNFMTIYEHNGYFRHGKPGGWLSDCPKTEKVEFESVDFNNKWTVYASDPQEAFYIVTPQFMETINNFEEKYHGTCYFGFMNNQFHVAIDNGANMFSSVWEKPTQEQYQGFVKEAKLIIEMIEALNLVKEHS